jgi:Short C-terminal domain
MHDHLPTPGRLAMTASRRMWLSFVLFGVTFFVFDSGMTRDESWPRPLVIGCGVASGLFFLYAMYVFYFDVTRGDRHLQKQGIRGTAVVLRATRTRTMAQTGQADFQAPFIWKYRLNVSLPGKQPYEAVCSVARDGIPEGSTVDVAVSRFNRRSIAILSRRPGQGAARGSGQGPVIFSAGSPSGGQDPAGRLQSVLRAAEAGGVHIQAPDPEASHLAALAKLGELHSQGVLTDEEFAAEKTRIIGQ